MKHFGANIARVWEGLRPTTRHLVERALTTPRGAAQSYDTRADGELSRLLDALDQRLARQPLNAPQTQQLQQLADACAVLLQDQTRSAEVFAQLVIRAQRRYDFARLDALGGALAARFAAREICEVARHPHAAARALGLEALIHRPAATLANLLADPGDAALARYALERQALDYNSEEAYEILYFLDDDDGESGVGE